MKNDKPRNGEPFLGFVHFYDFTGAFDIRDI